jgi:hypothetical protein
MLTPESSEFQLLIKESTRLRQGGHFNEAVSLVESRFGDMAPQCLTLACHHTIKVAREGGMNEVLLRHANELAKIAPDHPILKEIGREGGMNELLFRRSAS